MDSDNSQVAVYVHFLSRVTGDMLQPQSPDAYYQQKQPESATMPQKRTLQQRKSKF